MIAPDNNALVQASQWVAEVATGSIASGAATIAVAAIGFAMLAGRVDIRRGTTVIVGCFILFAAPTIAHAFMDWSLGSAEPAVKAAYAAPLPAAPAPPPSQPNDPYAGASLIR